MVHVVGLAGIGLALGVGLALFGYVAYKSLGSVRDSNQLEKLGASPATQCFQPLMGSGPGPLW